MLPSDPTWQSTAEFRMEILPNRIDVLFIMETADDFFIEKKPRRLKSPLFKKGKNWCVDFSTNQSQG